VKGEPLHCRVQKEAGRTLGNDAPLLAKHALDTRLGLGDEEDPEALEAPAIDDTPLFEGEVVAELLATDARLVDEPVGGHVHAAQVALEREVVAGVGIVKRKKAVGDDGYSYEIVSVVEGDAQEEGSLGGLCWLGHVPENFMVVGEVDGVLADRAIDVEHGLSDFEQVLR
jgi:hypothetical protein